MAGEPATLTTVPSRTDDEPMHVLLVDDISIYSESLGDSLARAPAVHQVVPARTLSEAIHHMNGCRTFDVALLNTAMTHSLHILRTLAGGESPTPVIALGVTDGQDVVVCAEAGVAGYLPRDGSVNDLLAVMRSATRGEAPCSPRVAASLFRRVANLAARQPDGQIPLQAQLTPRELQVLGLLSQGLSNKEISQQLCIEVRTVKNHVHNLLDKLGVRRRGEAVALMRDRLGVPDPLLTVAPMAGSPQLGGGLLPRPSTDAGVPEVHPPHAGPPGPSTDALEGLA